MDSFCVVDLAWNKVVRNSVSTHWVAKIPRGLRLCSSFISRLIICTRHGQRKPITFWIKYIRRIKRYSCDLWVNSHNNYNNSYILTLKFAIMVLVLCTLDNLDTDMDFRQIIAQTTQYWSYCSIIIFSIYDMVKCVYYSSSNANTDVLVVHSN